MINNTRRVWRSGGAGGFTLIEVVVVLALLAILAAVAIARISNTATVDVVSQIAVVKNHLRYAQSQAMNSNSPWGVHFTSGTSYSVFRDGDKANVVTLPGESSPALSLPADMAFGGTGAGIVAFDTWGTPYENDAGTITQSQPRTITLSKGGYSESLTITPNTGFIP